MAVGHQNRAHALLSASGSSRWLNCTAAPLLEENYPSKSSKFAEEGTLAHELAEITLRKHLNLITDKVYNQEVKKIKYNDFYNVEFHNYVNEYVDQVLEIYNSTLADCPTAQISLEVRVDYSHLVEGGFGSVDVAIVADKVCKIIDLKFGKGVPVDAYENSQLKLYAIGAIHEYDWAYDIEEVELTIIQPRLYNTSTFAISRSDLDAWGDTVVKPKAIEALSGGVHKAGKWCKFCKAKVVCRAYNEMNLQAKEHQFADPNLMSPEELAQIYETAEALAEWAKGIKEYMLTEALNGRKFEGFKVVAGRSTRKWIDEQNALSVLKSESLLSEDDLFKKEFISVATAEKLIGKKQFNDFAKLVDKSEGAPTLVPESDKRPSITESLLNLLDD